MPRFIELLEEITGVEQVISIPAAEVDNLVQRFGPHVRQMGRWNASSDGSLTIPVSVVREAAKEMDSRALHDALMEIKSGSLTQMLKGSAAVLLIDKIRAAYDRHFRQVMDQYQNTTNPEDMTRLRDQLVHEVFGE